MRIHSDNLNTVTPPQLIRIMADRNVTIHVTGKHGSRKRRQAFEVALRGHGAQHRRAPQGRVTDDPSSEKAATYDDWGRFLAALYSIDPTMIAGPYTSVGDFNFRTEHKF